MFKTAVSFSANFAVHPVRTDLILHFADVLSLNERNTHGKRLEVVVNSPIFNHSMPINLEVYKS